MAKICTEEGCKNPQFGGGYCKYHQFKRKMRGGDLYKPRKAQKPIPKESKKRKKEHITYLEQRRMFIQENKDNGTYFCFITGEEFDNTLAGFCTIHHLRGRTGDYYLDKAFWIIAKNQAHLDVFHNERGIDELQQEPWWDDFLGRLKLKDIQSYHKIQKRIEKSKNLFGYLD